MPNLQFVVVTICIPQMTVAVVADADADAVADAVAVTVTIATIRIQAPRVEVLGGRALYVHCEGLRLHLIITIVIIIVFVMVVCALPGREATPQMKIKMTY